MGSRVVPWILVSGSTSATGAAGGGQRVLLLGPDDEARRALHLLLDRAGKQVAAMADADGAQRYLETTDCDAVIATGDARDRAARPRHAPHAAGDRGGAARAISDAARALLAAGIDDVVSEPVDELAIVLALRHVGGAGRARLPAVVATVAGRRWRGDAGSCAR